MNNNFKTNKMKPHMLFPSPYQRPIPEKKVDRSVQQSFVNNPQPGNSMRYPIDIAPFKRSFQNTTNPTNVTQPMFLNNSCNAMKMSYPSNTYIPTQDCIGEIPFHYKLQNYPPNCTEEYEAFMIKNNSYEYNVMRDNMTPTMLDRNTVLEERNIAFQDRPPTAITKFEQKVRFNIPENNNVVTTKTKDKTNLTKQENVPKVRKLQQDKSMRILSGTIEKILKWQKIPDSVEILMEVIGPFVALGTSDRRGAKMVLLRDQGTPVLQCIFYEIDRQLPYFTKGQLLRCVGKMVTKNKMWTFSIRAATPAEKAGIQRISFISQRALTALELSTPEP